MRTRALPGAVILALTMTVAACSGTDEDSMGDQPMTDDGSSESMTDEGMSGEETTSEEMRDEGMPDEDMTEESMGADEMGTRTGMFEGMGNSVTGSVQVSDTEIVLSDFTADGAAELHLYLTNGTDEDAVAEGLEIADVAADQESQTFELDNMAAAADYDTVVIEGDMMAVLGSAALS